MTPKRGPDKLATDGVGGGVITDWRGEPCYGGGDVLACGDAALHAKLLARIGA